VFLVCIWVGTKGAVRYVLWCYLVFITCTASYIGLCVSVLVSIIWRLLLLISYMRYFPSLYVVMMPVVPTIVPYLCAVFNVLVEYSKQHEYIAQSNLKGGGMHPVAL
jgi:hypothetical protein